MLEQPLPMLVASCASAALGIISSICIKNNWNKTISENCVVHNAVPTAYLVKIHSGSFRYPLNFANVLRKWFLDRSQGLIVDFLWKRNVELRDGQTHCVHLLPFSVLYRGRYAVWSRSDVFRLFLIISANVQPWNHPQPIIFHVKFMFELPITEDSKFESEETTDEQTEIVWSSRR